MIHTEKARIAEILHEDEEVQELFVIVNQSKEKAINYIRFTGKCRPDDIVRLNTTAVRLDLGTGGYHFVMAIIRDCQEDLFPKDIGHIMKLRYTPLQLKCYTLEEMSPQTMNSFSSLKKTPVLLLPLHSMLPAVLVAIKETNSSVKVGYIMTDGGALPIAFSKIVKEMKQLGWLDLTITTGNSFGGDFESINLYTALIGGREILNCDILLVGMGPGHVGSNTKYGYTGVEQGQQVDIVQNLGGTPIFVPRISFADLRDRHFGVSHHTLTNLTKICYSKSIIGIPQIQNKTDIILDTLKKYNIHTMHDIIVQSEHTIEWLRKNKIHCSTMGRTMEEDEIFFKTAGACGLIAANALRHLQKNN